MASSYLLTGFAAVLAGLVAVELHFTSQWPNSRSPAQIALQTVSAKIGVYAPKSAISAWSAELLARPLFDPSRRPPAVAPAARMEIPRLSGIIIGPTETFAVFSPSVGGSIIVTKNSRVGPFAVLSITADGVTVKGPDGVTVMRVAFSSQGWPETATPAMTILPGGIDVSFIRVPLGSVKASWPSGLNPF